LHSGYYKQHGIKFQGVVGPNGLIIEVYGPLPGARAGSHMLYNSKFRERMATMSQSLMNGEHFYLCVW